MTCERPRSDSEASTLNISFNKHLIERAERHQKQQECDVTRVFNCTTQVILHSTCGQSPAGLSSGVFLHPECERESGGLETSSVATD